MAPKNPLSKTNIHNYQCKTWYILENNLLNIKYLYEFAETMVWLGATRKL